MRVRLLIATLNFETFGRKKRDQKVSMKNAVLHASTSVQLQNCVFLGKQDCIGFWWQVVVMPAKASDLIVDAGAKANYGAAIGSAIASCRGEDRQSPLHRKSLREPMGVLGNSVALYVDTF